jgi:hypothetical protein
MSRHPLDTWPDLKSGVGQAVISRSQGLDFEAEVQEVFNIRSPLPKYHSGQLEKIDGQQRIIWEHPKFVEDHACLGCMHDRVGLDHSMTHEVVGSGQGETRMPEHIGLSPAEEGWTVANDNETCLVVALNCNVLQH